MTFRLPAMAAAVICAVLFPILLIFPTDYMKTYGLVSTPEAAFMSRRASPTLLGLAVLLWLVRDVTDPLVQRAVAAGVCVTFAGIAVTGCYEYLTGLASFNILIAAAGEMVIVLVFARFLRRPVS